MAFLSLNRSAHGAIPTLFDNLSPAGVLARLRDLLRAWSLKRRTRLELEMLSDRELADVGLTRAQIGKVVRELP